MSWSDMLVVSRVRAKRRGYGDHQQSKQAFFLRDDGNGAITLESERLTQTWAPPGDFDRCAGLILVL